MKITIDKRYGTCSHRDLQYIKLLEVHPVFEEVVNKAREMCNITAPIPNYPDPETYKITQEAAREIIDLFDLPESWIMPISDFIVLGKFTYYGDDGIYISGLSYKVVERGKKIYYKTDKLTVTIDRKIGYYDLLNYVKNNHKRIKTHLDELPRRNRRNKDIKYFQIKLDAYRLGLAGSKPSEIANVLAKRYENNIFLHDKIDPTVISRWLFEMNQYLHGKTIK